MSVLKDLFSRGAEKLAASVGDAFDQNFTTKEEREAKKIELQKEINRHLEAIQASADKELELQNANTADARAANVSIQSSENASWLSKNVGYIIDLLLLIAFLIMLAMIFFHTVPEENHELFYVGFGTLGGYLGTSINFHRGTSQGSAEKQKMLDRMIRK